MGWIGITGSNRAVGVVAILALAGLFLIGCGERTDSLSIAAQAVDGKPGFAPATLTVGKGDKVVLTVDNKTQKTHGFSIDGYGIARTVDPASPITVEFTADHAGTFRIFCQLHPAHQSVQLVVQ